MVGRTPEYLGKKIESYDVKMAMLAILILTFTILGFSAVAIVKPFGTSSISNRSEEHTSELQSRLHLVCRLLLEKKKNSIYTTSISAKSATPIMIHDIHHRFL